MEDGMTIFDMLGQSGVLTILGMAIVFGFLFILVICVTMMGKVIQKLGFTVDVLEPKPTAASGSDAAGASSGVIAAIGAAVSEYRKTENRG